MQGTSTDAIVAPGNIPSGVLKVNVRISTGSFTYFWTGSSWTANTNTWLQATLSPSATFWYYPQALWATNVNYTAEAYAVDKTTNTQVVYSTVSFIADFTAPISTITFPNSSPIIVALTSLSGTATDYAPGQLADVQLSYYRQDINRYWNSVTQAFDSTTELFSTCTVNTGTGNWSVTGTNVPGGSQRRGGITYDVFAKAIDLAGNGTTKPGSPAFNSSFIEFVLKAPAPVTTLHRRTPPIPILRRSQPSSQELLPTGRRSRFKFWIAD